MTGNAIGWNANFMTVPLPSLKFTVEFSSVKIVADPAALALNTVLNTGNFVASMPPAIPPIKLICPFSLLNSGGLDPKIYGGGPSCRIYNFQSVFRKIQSQRN
jgi:hypothetical protein